MKYKILWADDEIDLLKAHIMFLAEKDVEIVPVNNGVDALEMIKKEDYDMVFLDESMPGMTGLEVLVEIKKIKENVPVVMITKNEAEHIMEEAIGGKISDYLIKPIKPNQILLVIKKQLENKRLISESANTQYQKEFQKISMLYNDYLDADEWVDVYKDLVRHEVNIDETEGKSMEEVLNMQKAEANKLFSRFVEDNYEDWIQNKDEAPLMSDEVMAERVFPLIRDGEKVFFILIDNLRYDQWKVLSKELEEFFSIVDESLFYSILPTATAYARNAIFSGLMPLEISKKYPNHWLGDEDEGGKNLNEEFFLGENLKRNKLDVNFSYNKVIRPEDGEKLVNSYKNLEGNDLNVAVFNFVDMLSHARTDMQMIKNLAKDESAYRSLTHTWFKHSNLLELLKKIKDSDFRVIITTDHGTVRVKRPTKIVGDRKTNSNLRYKNGKTLTAQGKGIWQVKDPEKIGLPRIHGSSSFAFAEEDHYLVYPNNYNHYVNMYDDSFQHGGISLEEMIIPIIELKAK